MNVNMCYTCYQSPCICNTIFPGNGWPADRNVHNSNTFQWLPFKKKLSDEDIARIAEKVVLSISAERKELEELRAFKAGILALVGLPGLK